MKTPRILSIQSQVVHGHVGNSIAVFAMQRLGIEVLPLHTLQFSNHPGYGSFKGRVADASELMNLLDGLDAGGFLDGIDGVISGYLGKAETGQVVLEAVRRVKARNASALFFCDPVMGDEGEGLYVAPDAADFFKSQALPAADVLFPNRFELGFLTGEGQDLAAALAALQIAGPQTIVLTSAEKIERPKPAIRTLLCYQGAVFQCETPLLKLAANGTGDGLAALFAAHLLKGAAAPDALSLALSGLHAVIEATVSKSSNELALVEAQDALVSPPRLFPVERISP